MSTTLFEGFETGSMAPSYSRALPIGEHEIYRDLADIKALPTADGPLDLDFGLIHEPSLGDDMMEHTLHKIMSAVTHRPAVENMLGKFMVPANGFESYDRGSYEHQVRVSVLTAAVLLDMGADQNIAWLGALAAIEHDNGKAAPDIQSAILSQNRIFEDETLLPRINRHPAVGALNALRLGESSNVAGLIERHHSYKPGDDGQGPSYSGLFADVPIVGEVSPFNGEVFTLLPKDIKVIGEVIAACDVYDAVTASRIRQERLYQNREDVNGVTLSADSLQYSQLRLSAEACLRKLTFADSDRKVIDSLLRVTGGERRGANLGVRALSLVGV